MAPDTPLSQSAPAPAAKLSIHRRGEQFRKQLDGLNERRELAGLPHVTQAALTAAAGLPPHARSRVAKMINGSYVSALQSRDWPALFLALTKLEPPAPTPSTRSTRSTRSIRSSASSAPPREKKQLELGTHRRAATASVICPADGYLPWRGQTYYLGDAFKGQRVHIQNSRAKRDTSIIVATVRDRRLATPIDPSTSQLGYTGAPPQH